MKERPQVIYINPKSSKIKKFNISRFKLLISFLSFGIIVFLALKVSSNIMLKSNYNSYFSKLKQENRVLVNQLTQMDQKILSLRSQITQIETMDDQVRNQLALQPIDSSVRQVGIGGSDISQFSSLEISDMRLNTSLEKNQQNLDRLEREIKLELGSFKKLVNTAARKKDSLRYLPIINPVPEGHPTDGFGRRLHPILKRIMMHYGQDFGAKRGAPIFAPADGRVTFVGKNHAYGLFISINHKYGYVTKYGHLRKAFVKRGEHVKRGEKIGEVGNTGRSTAPHLHYEVLYQGKAVNPAEYYFPDVKFE